MDNQDIALHTDRLIVRRFRESDISDILDYSQYDEDDRFRKRNADWEPTKESALTYWTPMTTMPIDEATSWLGLRHSGLGPLRRRHRRTTHC